MRRSPSSQRRVRRCDRPIAYALAGRKEEARRLVRAGLAAADAAYQSYQLAGAYLGLGEYDEALTWLEKAVSLATADVILLKVDPRLAPLREHPRYRELLRKGGWD